MEINCPVCDYTLAFWPVRDEICHSCGIQFGYDDAAGGSLDLQLATYSEWRKAWTNNNKQQLSNEQVTSLHEQINKKYT